MLWLGLRANYHSISTARKTNGGNFTTKYASGSIWFDLLVAGQSIGSVCDSCSTRLGPDSCRSRALLGPDSTAMVNSCCAPTCTGFVSDSCWIHTVLGLEVVSGFTCIRVSSTVYHKQLNWWIWKWCDQRVPDSVSIGTAWVPCIPEIGYLFDHVIYTIKLINICIIYS